MRLVYTKRVLLFPRTARCARIGAEYRDLRDLKWVVEAVVDDREGCIQSGRASNPQPGSFSGWQFNFSRCLDGENFRRQNE
jgi:hypothetical protein